MRPESAVDMALPEGFEETELGLLPKDWEIVRLGHLTAIKYGKAKPKESGEIPAVGSGGVYGWTSVALVDFPTLVVGRKGTAGKVWLQEQPCWPSDTTFYLEWNSKEIDHYFLYNWLREKPLSGEHAKTTLPSLSKPDLENYLVPLPSLPEQNAIAYVLRTVQKAIESTEKVIEATRELKRSLMNHLFTYGPVSVDEAEQVPLKETEIGLVPEHWKLIRLGAVSRLLSGGTPSKKRTEWWQGTIPWASPKDLKVPRLEDTQDHISEEALAEGSRLAPAGTIFIVVRGMILARDLPVAITKVPMAFNQDLKAISPEDDIEPDYLFYTLTAYKRLLAKEIGTSAHGTRRLGSSALEGWLLPLPPRQEQRQIGDAIYAVDKKIEAEVNWRRTLEALFCTLLHNLMTGKVRVQDFDLHTVEMV